MKTITHVFFLPVARIHRVVPRVRHLGRRVGIGRVVSRLARARREGGRGRGDARGGARGDGERAAEGGAHRLECRRGVDEAVDVRASRRNEENMK